MFLIGISEDPKAKGAGLQLKKVGLQGKGAGLQPKGAELPASFPLLLQRLAEAFEQRLPCERLIMGWRPRPQFVSIADPKVSFFHPKSPPPPPSAAVSALRQPLPAGGAAGAASLPITGLRPPL